MPDKSYRVLLNNWGIGDLLLSMYGVYGFCVKNNFPKLDYLADNHPEWLALFDIPNFSFSIVNTSLPHSVDFNLTHWIEDARQRWRSEVDTKEWYAQQFDCKPLKPPIKSAILDNPVDIPKPYVLFSPFAGKPNRTWEVYNWRILVRLLREKGYHCIAVDSPGQTERCKEIDVHYSWGAPIEWVTRVCKNADLVISNDSGIAHLAGLVDTKTLVIGGIHKPHQYYSMAPNHHFIHPDNMRCSPCNFLPENGYEEKCEFICWALQSISPNQVFESALEIISQPKLIL